MKILRSLLLLITGLLGGAGAAAYLLSKAPPETRGNMPEKTTLTRSPTHPLTPSQDTAAELEQWKERARLVQGRIKEMEESLLVLCRGGRPRRPHWCGWASR